MSGIAHNRDIVRDVVRILCLLYFCGEQNNQMFLFVDDDKNYSHHINSELKLQKLDFWLRYPDHLALALLRLCQPGEPFARQALDIQQIVINIFTAEEPHLRWIPMRRFFHGAYEPLDRAMLFLSSRKLAYRIVDRLQPRTTYYLTAKGRTVVERMARECLEVQWYIDRCQLINRFFGDLSGFDIRKQQYMEPSYQQAPLNTTIEQVTASVRNLYETTFGVSL
jgi:hypothetical protein